RAGLPSETARISARTTPGESSRRQAFLGARSYIRKATQRFPHGSFGSYMRSATPRTPYRKLLSGRWDYNHRRSVPRTLRGAPRMGAIPKEPPPSVNRYGGVAFTRRLIPRREGKMLTHLLILPPCAAVSAAEA